MMGILAVGDILAFMELVPCFEGEKKLVVCCVCGGGVVIGWLVLSFDNDRLADQISQFLIKTFLAGTTNNYKKKHWRFPALFKNLFAK